MFKRLYLVRHWFLLACLTAPPVAAQDRTEAASDGAAVRQLMQILGEVETMTAEVEQLTLDQSGREVQESRAELVVRKPDDFYWHTIEPYEEIMTTNGEVIWIYEPDLEQVTVQDFSDDVSRTPALLLSEDEATLRESFDISMNEREHGDGVRFTLLPREPGSLFENLTMTFEEGVLREMHFEDSLGQKTRLSFRDVTLNQPVDEDIFTFEAPEGVDVIDSTSR